MRLEIYILPHTLRRLIFADIKFRGFRDRQIWTFREHSILRSDIFCNFRRFNKLVWKINDKKHVKCNSTGKLTCFSTLSIFSFHIIDIRQFKTSLMFLNLISFKFVIKFTLIFADINFRATFRGYLICGFCPKRQIRKMLFPRKLLSLTVNV